MCGIVILPHCVSCKHNEGFDDDDERERDASLSVPEFDAHGVRLVLQALDLGADGSQVCLRTREVEKEEAEGELEEEEGGG